MTINAEPVRRPRQPRGRLLPERDLERVQQYRSDPAYLELCSRLERLFAGKRVLVVGSSRDLVAPVRHPGDVVICINGSAVNSESMGVKQPDVTLLLGHMLRRTSRHSRATFDTLNGRSTGTLFCLTSVVSMQDCLPHLAASGFSAQWTGEIDAVAKAAITGAVFGEEFGFGKVDERVSNGMLAIACALVGGASKVILCGFSLRGGHSYTTFTTPRRHLAPDRRFLTLCAGHRIPVSTTSPELARVIGLPLEAPEKPSRMTGRSQD